MVLIETISYLNEFFDYWVQVKGLSIENQIEMYPKLYLKENSYLFNKQRQIYEREGDNWKEIVKEFVFQNLSLKINHFRDIESILINSIVDLKPRLKSFFPENYKIRIVIYFGLGIGSGFADFYQNIPAVLFGLENIVDCNWLTYSTLSGLLAHEIGHLYHFYIRGEDDESVKGNLEHKSKYWQLYEEGFAMRMEQEIMQKESWHMVETNENWLFWCRENIHFLSDLFLDYIKNDKKVNDFFGSWLTISGFSQTGYFLGHEIIKELEHSNYSLKAIGLLSDKELDNIFPAILENL